MIQVSFSMDQDSGCLSMRLLGHAGYAEPGQDIVCSAASILAYTLAQAVSGMHQRGRLQEGPTLDLEEGKVEITCDPKEAAVGEAVYAYALIQDGFRLLSGGYGDYIQVTTMLGSGE